VHPAADGGLVVVCRDIDERKRAEQALRATARRFRAMLEALPLLAYVFRGDGHVIYYNRQFQHYIGRPVGPSPAARDALVHLDDRARVGAARTEGFRSGREYSVEARVARHDGVYRWHRIHNRPMRFDAKLVLWLGTAVDIDDIRSANELLEERVAARTAELVAANRKLSTQIEEREEAEARLHQAQRIEAIGQLTAGIAHDFNNLLTSIIGNVELLQSRLGKIDDRTKRQLTAALSAAERGAALTTQLLAFSRQQRLNPEAVDLNRVVAGMTALLHSTIGASLRIEVNPAKGLWPALADITQVELVLLNLTINARDAMPDGGTIRIETGNVMLGPPSRSEEPPAGEFAMVLVADTGAGIPADIIDKVFDPFFTTKEVGKGSGLGLSQVLGVAQQLGGGVKIETQPGRGTVVKVFLPRVKTVPAGAGLRAAIESRGAEPVGRQRRTILLVDDDPDVRAVAAAMLIDAGHIVIEAGSGGAALECLHRNKPAIDMMIADIAMPGMSGIELARAALLNRPDLPILFVTGFADTVGFDEAVSAMVLQKPFRADDLAAKMAQVLAPSGTNRG
jgi:PAS domain S-box-containing protein